VLLNERIAEAFDTIADRLAGAAPVAARGQADTGDGFVVPPVLLATHARELSAELTEECFGPIIVVARYDTPDDLAAALELMPNSLTATVHAEDHEAESVSMICELLTPRAGRLVFNGYPTGVRVSWAQHHGGPWPSTNSQHTSVGVTAIRRFLRPFVWQNAPESVLPEELREDYTGIPRRVDGTLRLPRSD
jgi:NADP-dependent aldehyde dehydrogenase